MNKNLKEFTKRTGIVIFLLGFFYFLRNAIAIYFNIKEKIDLPKKAHLLYKFDLLKVIFFLSFIFILYNREILAKITIPKFKIKEFMASLIITTLLIILYLFIQYKINEYKLYSGAIYILLMTINQILLLLFLVLIVIAAYGTSYPKLLITKIKKQFYLFIPTAVFGTFLFTAFKQTWFFFSNIITKIIYYSLSSFYLISTAIYENKPIILINDFALSIGPPCSGIDSILLYVAFFASLFALDYKKIKKVPFAVFFVTGLVGVFFLNIIRLILLILVALNISKHLAVGIFHTNAAWILFVVYFLGYYWLIRRFIYYKKPVEDHRNNLNPAKDQQKNKRGGITKEVESNENHSQRLP